MIQRALLKLLKPPFKMIQTKNTFKMNDAILKKSEDTFC